MNGGFVAGEVIVKFKPGVAERRKETRTARAAAFSSTRLPVRGSNS